MSKVALSISIVLLFHPSIGWTAPAGHLRTRRAVEGPQAPVAVPWLPSVFFTGRQVPEKTFRTTLHHLIRSARFQAPDAAEPLVTTATTHSQGILYFGRTADHPVQCRPIAHVGEGRPATVRLLFTDRFNPARQEPPQWVLAIHLMDAEGKAYERVYHFHPDYPFLETLIVLQDGHGKRDLLRTFMELLQSGRLSRFERRDFQPFTFQLVTVGNGEITLGTPRRGGPPAKIELYAQLSKGHPVELETVFDDVYLPPGESAQWLLRAHTRDAQGRVYEKVYRFTESPPYLESVMTLRHGTRDEEAIERIGAFLTQVVWGRRSRVSTQDFEPLTVIGRTDPKARVYIGTPISRTADQSQQEAYVTMPYKLPDGRPLPEDTPVELTMAFTDEYTPGLPQWILTAVPLDKEAYDQDGTRQPLRYPDTYGGRTASPSQKAKRSQEIVKRYVLLREQHPFLGEIRALSHSTILLNPIEATRLLEELAREVRGTRSVFPLEKLPMLPIDDESWSGLFGLMGNVVDTIQEARVDETINLEEIVTVTEAIDRCEGSGAWMAIQSYARLEGPASIHLTLNQLASSLETIQRLRANLGDLYIHSHELVEPSPLETHQLSMRQLHTALLRPGRAAERRGLQHGKGQRERDDFATFSPAMWDHAPEQRVEDLTQEGVYVGRQQPPLSPEELKATRETIYTAIGNHTAGDMVILTVRGRPMSFLLTPLRGRFFFLPVVTGWRVPTLKKALTQALALKDLSLPAQTPFLLLPVNHILYAGRDHLVGDHRQNLMLFFHHTLPTVMQALDRRLPGSGQLLLQVLLEHELWHEATWEAASPIVEQRLALQDARRLQALAHDAHLSLDDLIKALRLEGIPIEVEPANPSSPLRLILGPPAAGTLGIRLHNGQRLERAL